MPAMIASGSLNCSLPKVTLPNGWIPTSRTARPDSRSARASPPVDAPVPTAPTTVSGPSGSEAVSRSANSRYPSWCTASWYCRIQWKSGRSARSWRTCRTRSSWSRRRLWEGGIRSTVAPSTSNWASIVASTVVDATMWQRSPYR